MQIVINILITSFYLIIISLSFLLIYLPTKFFNLAHAATITLAPYLTFLLSNRLGLDLIIAILISIIITVMFGFSTDKFLFKPLRSKGASPLILLISSLGLYIITENLISLLFGNQILSIRDTKITSGYNLFDASITSTQLILILSSVIIYFIVIYILNKTDLGKKIRATSSNLTFATILGVNTERVIKISFVLGSLIAAIAGILIALDINMSPNMGFNLLLLSVVAMIIGGVGSIWGLVVGSLLLATAQNLGAYYIDSKWMNAIAYLILIILLMWKPLGFSGKQLKKVEI